MISVPRFSVSTRHQRLLRHVVDDQHASQGLGVFKSLEFSGHQLRPHFELLLVFLVILGRNQTAHQTGAVHFDLRVHSYVPGSRIVYLLCIAHE